MEGPTDPVQISQASGKAAGKGSAAHQIKWAEVWHAPVMALSFALLTGGLTLAVLTRPAPDHESQLQRVEHLLSNERPEEAISVLNRSLHPYESRGELDDAQHRVFHLLVGRALYLGQQALGLDVEENHRRILEAYVEAERAGASLNADDNYFLARTLISLGRVDQALLRAERQPRDQTDRWLDIQRRAIDRDIDHPGGDQSRALTTLSAFLTDPRTSESDRAWAAARQGRVLLDKGMAAGAIDRLLRDLQRVSPDAGEERARLLLLLAEAYLAEGREREARPHASRALEMLPPLAPLHPEAILMMARADEASGDTETARERYGRVIDRYFEHNAAIRALLGLAETEAMLGSTIESIAAYRQLRDELDGGRRHRDVSVEGVMRSLLRRYVESFQREDYRSALAYAQIADSLYEASEAPPEVLLAVAEARAELASGLIEAGSGDPLAPRGIAGLDPASREEARRHLIAAGSYFQRHAETMVLRDEERYASSLWRSADAFDLAGSGDRAMRAFLEFQSGFPGDARQAEARFRLGQLYQSRGEYRLAAGFYRELIEGKDPEVKNVGLFADLSYVPLAQCLLLDGREEEHEEAERLLRMVVDGRVVREPDPRTRRDALVELGKHLLVTGRYAESARLLDEALRRFPTDQERALNRFRLADALRLEAEEMGRQLDGSIPDHQRRTLTSQRRTRLNNAMGMFEEVIQELESRPRASLSAVERESLRNAYFYRAACAYDLGDFATAVRYYDAAHERYADDPASLVALVQIVNAFIEQGQLDRARTSNERARRYFASLPDDVWDDPYLPMDRTQWERWLQSTSRLYAMQEER